MSAIKNVALAGASGILGKEVLKAFIEAGKFNITILSREDSDATFPATVQVVKINYDSIDSLTAALQGKDAVISTVTTAAIASQEPLIRAAAAVGVKRFIPAEFSSNLANPKAAALLVYANQIKIQGLLQETAKSNPEFSYTSIRNGAFLDWGLALGFQLDLRSENPPFYDGGDRPFSTTTLPTIAKATVAVLDHLPDTRNRAVYVHDVVTTQRHLLYLARKVAPERHWEPVSVSTEDLERVARENYKRGEFGLEASIGFFSRSVFAEGFGGAFERVDNELLGLGVFGDDDLEILLKGVLGLE
ncbi:hypothetical protein BJY04DRAFT_223067 [Aspergillus karnatakaensis]|uniref:aromatic alcohol reductase n=1 Tax=Aspergillus karnatakaensis TaxID=1810916 RepID=UPI003CCDBA52